MSDPTAITNRTLGFRARLEARLEPLLELARQETGALADCPGLATVTATGLAELFERYLVRLIHGLVENKPMLKRAVLDRMWLAEHWNLRDHGVRDLAARALLDRLIACEQRAGKAPEPPFWPTSVSPDDLAQALLRTGDPEALLLAEGTTQGLFFPSDRDGKLGVDSSLYVRDGERTDGEKRVSEKMEAALETWPLLPCARVVAACKMVLADLRKPSIAIDAGKVNHELLSGWSRVARANEVLFDTRPGRVELVLPGAEHRPAMLTLPLDGPRLSQAFVEAIREWRSFLGLRHWIALQALFSIQGRREGRVLWKLEDHLDALGVSRRWRADPERRASVVREVSLLTKMQLVIYKPDGTVRARHSMLITTGEIDVQRDGDWLLEGLELQMHPWLYSGVRDQKTGQLGRHWHPAPPELAKIDHDKFRHALVLGLILPIRWRWLWAEEGKDHLTLEAGKLLELACIETSPHNPGRAWEALDRNLAELHRIGLLGQFVWVGEPHTAAARVLLYPSDWLLDRTLQGLQPVEKILPSSLPTRGGELGTWRRARGWTQPELASRLGVGERTVRRAEETPERPLGRALTAALRNTDAVEPTSTPPPPRTQLDPDDPP